MIRADTVLERGTWEGEAVDTVVLDYDARHRRRIAMQGLHGFSFLLDLPRPVAISSGDALRLEDGRLIAVQAAEEELLEVTCDNRFDLMRVAWHLGNRHLPTEIHDAALFIRYDHVIEEMLKGLGAWTTVVKRPFQPEGGAYGQGSVMGHSHGPQDHKSHDQASHDHGHAHGHHHHHGHGHGHGHA